MKEDKTEQSSMDANGVDADIDTDIPLLPAPGSHDPAPELPAYPVKQVSADSFWLQSRWVQFPFCPHLQICVLAEQVLYFLTPAA